MAVIHVSGFRKTYGSTVAGDDVSFDVNAGEIYVHRISPSCSTGRQGLQPAKGDESHSSGSDFRPWHPEVKK